MRQRTAKILLPITVHQSRKKKFSCNVIYSAFFISACVFLLTHNGARFSAKSTTLTHTQSGYQPRQATSVAILQRGSTVENSIDSSTESHLPPHPNSACASRALVNSLSQFVWLLLLLVFRWHSALDLGHRHTAL